MAKPQPKKEVKKPGTEVATRKAAGPLVLVQEEAPDHIRLDSNRGSENVTTADLVIPRLEIVQATSPAAKPKDPGYIKGATAGMLNNSVTRELYGDTVLVVPVHYSMQYLVWRNRKEAERQKKPIDGFWGAYTTLEEAKDRCAEEGGDKECIEVVDTPTHLVLLLDMKEGKADEVMISMPRTKAKISRQWNSMIKLAGGDRFGRVYTIGTAYVDSDKGDYYNYAVSQKGFASKALYEQAEKLYKVVKEGSRRVIMDTGDLDQNGGKNADDSDM